MLFDQAREQEGHGMFVKIRRNVGDSNSLVLVPVSNASEVGLRSPISSGECEMLFKILADDFSFPANDWKDRFKEFSENRRRNVRKAIKSGVEVGLASTREEFDSYYQIYVGWSERKNLPILPFEVIERALNLTGNRKLFLARFEGEIIAGVIIRTFPGGMIEYAANSSLPEYLKLRPNDLLQWRIVEWACGEGYKRYSLGGAHLFVRRMGGDIVPVYRYRLDRTLLHRHELKEALGRSGRNMFNALPGGLKSQVRRALGRHE